MPDGLNPGDKVVALAAAARTAGILAGVIAGSVCAWISMHKAVASLIGFIGGGILGAIIGTILGKMIFPSSPGNIFVAKCGLGSLPLTLKGNIAASAVTGIVLCVVLVLVGKADFRSIAGPCIGISVFVGIASAFLSSLL